MNHFVRKYLSHTFFVKFIFYNVYKTPGLTPNTTYSETWIVGTKMQILQNNI